MERLCYRCNAPVATGTPFCPQCNAPQIRVVAESEHAQSLDEDSSVAWSASTGNASNSIRWSAAVARAAVAAIASVALLQLITAFSKSAALAFLAFPIGGGFAVYLYSRRQPGPLSPGMGARLGAVTGFFIFVIAFSVFLVGLLADRHEVFQIMQKAFKDAAANNPSPQTDALIQQISTPAGMTTILLLASVLFLFASLILCALGGTVGASLFNRRR